MRKFQKISAVVLAIAMVLSLMSVNVFADSAQNVYYILEATSVTDGQFTVNVYVADSATGTIQNADGFYLALTQLEISYDSTVISVADSTKRANAYYGGVGFSENLVKLATLNAAGTEFKGTATPAAVLTCTVLDATKGSTTLTAGNAKAYDENSDTIPAELIHVSDPITVSFGGSAPEPTATPDAPVVTDAPTATPAPTAAPTATPEAQSIKITASNYKYGSDYTVTVTRTVKGEAATAVVTLKNGADVTVVSDPIINFSEDDVKAKATFTADKMATLGEIGTAFTITVDYTEGDETITVSTDASIVKKSTSTSSNSGITVGPDGTTSKPTATPGPSTDDVTEPTEAPDATEVPAETSVFTDVPASHWAYSYIMDLYEAGIVNGATATEFMPDANVTRAEFTKMAVGVFGLTATTTTTQFVDVPATAWYAEAVAAATEAGIVQGITDTEFGPEENITREQMATIIGRQYGMMNDTTLTYTDAADVEAYAVPYVAALSEAGYLTGDNGMFYPKNNATRAEAATLLDRVYVAIAVVEPEATETPEADAEATEAPEADVEATEAPEADVEATETPEADAEATATPDAE